MTEILLDFTNTKSRVAEPSVDRPDSLPFGTIEGELPKISLNQLLVWDRCKFLWKFMYRQHWTKAIKGRRLALGTMGHEMLFDWYKTGLDHSVDFANKWLSDLDNMNADQIKNVSIATAMFKLYTSEFSPTEDRNLLTQSLEEHFEVELVTPKGRQFLLEGYIDRTSIDQRGHLWLEDYKWTERFWSTNQLLMDPQLSFYAGALRTLDRPVHGLMITQVNTYDYKDRSKKKVEELIRRERLYRSPEELQAVMVEIGHKVDEMIDGQDQLTRSLRRDCDRCDFMEPCLFGLKGIDPESYIPSSGLYKKREKRPTEEKKLDGNGNRLRV